MSRREGPGSTRAFCLSFVLVSRTVLPRAATVLVVPNRRVIPLLEAVSIISAHVARHRRMTELIAIPHIPRTMILEITFRALHTIQKSLPLELVQLARRPIPTALPVLRRRSGRRPVPTLRRSISLCHCGAGHGSQPERKCKCSQPSHFHILFPFANQRFSW